MTIPIFICHSTKDATAYESLECHLKPLVTNERIRTWSSRQLLGGALQEDQIRAEIRRSRIILFLVTANLLASDYVTNIELPEALERAGVAVLVPIIVSDCLWRDTRLGLFNAIPREQGRLRTVSSFSDPATAWTAVVKELKRVLAEIEREDASIKSVRRMIRGRMERHASGMFTSALTQRAQTRAYDLIVPLHVEDFDGRVNPKLPPVSSYDDIVALARNTSERHCVFVEGEPGSGKTTLAAYIAYHLAQDDAARLPIFLSARQFHPNHPDPVEAIRRTIKLHCDIDVDGDTILRLLDTGKVALILDGINYLPSSPPSSSQPSAQRDDYCVSLPGRHKDLTIIITCRAGVYDQPRVPPFRFLKIRPFTMEQLDSFVRRWASVFGAGPFDAAAHAGARMALGLGDGPRQVTSIAEWTPLLASLLLASYRVADLVPMARGEIHQLYVDWVLSMLHDRTRNEEYSTQYVMGHAIRGFLERAAFEMVEKEQYELLPVELRDNLVRFSSGRLTDDAAMSRVDAMVAAGFLVRRGRDERIGFVHRSVLDYLAGRGFLYKYQPSGYEYIAQHAIQLIGTPQAYRKWSEPFLLLLGSEDRLARVFLDGLRTWLRVRIDSLARSSPGERSDRGYAPAVEIWYNLIFGLRVVRETAMEDTDADYLLDCLRELTSLDDTHLSMLGKRTPLDANAVSALLRPRAHERGDALRGRVVEWARPLLDEAEAQRPERPTDTLVKWASVVPLDIMDEGRLRAIIQSNADFTTALLRLWPYSEAGATVARLASKEEVLRWAKAEACMYLAAPRALVFLEAEWDDGAAAWTVALLRRAAWIASTTRDAQKRMATPMPADITVAAGDLTIDMPVIPTLTPANPLLPMSAAEASSLEWQITNRSLSWFHSKMRYSPGLAQSVSLVAAHIEKAFRGALPKLVDRRISLEGDTWTAMIEGALRYFADHGVMPYPRDVTTYLRGLSWSVREGSALHQVPNAGQQSIWTHGGAAPGIVAYVLTRHWLETIVGVIVGKSSGVPNGWMLGALRAQNLWFHTFWDQLVEIDGRDVLQYPGQLALALAAALAQYQTTMRWPGGARWVELFSREPGCFQTDRKRYWLARCAWHLCWTLTRINETGRHLGELYAALKDGDEQWPELARTLRELNLSPGNTAPGTP